MIEICFIARGTFRIYRKYLILEVKIPYGNAGLGTTEKSTWRGVNPGFVRRRKPAAERALPPQPVRVITDKRKKPVKHKKLLVEEA
jgi:hypothetical protein